MNAAIFRRIEYRTLFEDRCHPVVFPNCRPPAASKNEPDEFRNRQGEFRCTRFQNDSRQTVRTCSLVGVNGFENLMCPTGSYQNEAAANPSCGRLFDQGLPHEVRQSKLGHKGLCEQVRLCFRIEYPLFRFVFECSDPGMFRSIPEQNTIQAPPLFGVLREVLDLIADFRDVYLVTSCNCRNAFFAF